jgi:hypothetical protein
MSQPQKSPSKTGLEGQKNLSMNDFLDVTKYFEETF